MKHAHRIAGLWLVAGGFGAFGCGVPAAWGQSRWETLYATTNLSDLALTLEPNPGMTGGPPCVLADVSLASDAVRAEVTANARHTNVFVNAISYKKFLDAIPGHGPVSLGIYKYSGTVRLPVVPFPSVVQTQNAQCVQMMVQLWDGGNVLWNSGMTSLESTVYWDLNPWNTNLYEKIRIYTMQTGALHLVDTGIRVAADTNWHAFEAVTDLVNRRWVSVCWDGIRADVSAVGLAYVAHPEWTNDLGLSITAESMNTYPGAPPYTNVFWWTTEFKDLALSRLRFSVQIPDAPATSGVMTLRWESEPYLRYRVASSANLADWTESTNVWVGTGSNLWYSEPVSGTTCTYYRVHIVP